MITWKTSSFQWYYCYNCPLLPCSADFVALVVVVVEFLVVAAAAEFLVAAAVADCVVDSWRQSSCG